MRPCFRKSTGRGPLSGGMAWSLLLLFLSTPCFADPAPSPDSITAPAQEIRNEEKGRNDKATLNLRGMEALALQQNAQLRLRRADLKVAEQERKIAFSRFLPEIYGRAGYLYTDPPPGVKMELAPNTTLKLTMGATNNYSYGVAMDYILFAGGRRVYGYRAAKLGEEATQWLMKDDVKNTILEARHLYLQALLLKEMVALSEEANRRAVQRLGDAEEKLASGAISRLEFLRVKSEASDTGLLLRRALDRQEALRGEIRVFLFLGDSANFEVEGSPERLAELPPLLDEKALNEAKPEFLALKAVELRREQAELNVKAKKGNFFPSLNAGVSYDSVNPYLGQTQYGTNFQVRVGAKIPLFEGGRTLNEYRKAKEESERARIMSETTRSELNIRYSLLKDRIATLRKEIQAREVNREQALQTRDATKVARDNGAATFRELADSELLLFRSRVEYFGAVVEFLESVAQWERLGGGSAGLFERIGGGDGGELLQTEEMNEFDASKEAASFVGKEAGAGIRVGADAKQEEADGEKESGRIRSEDDGEQTKQGEGIDGNEN